MQGVEAMDEGPMETREEFMAELADLVAENAPGVFALCEEVGDRRDAYVRYWGLDFGDHAEVVSAVGNLNARFPSVARAHRRLSRRVNLHIVWAPTAPGQGGDHSR